jgi:hypothetical protein
MIRSLAVLCLLAGCTHSTELLSPIEPRTGVKTGTVVEAGTVADADASPPDDAGARSLRPFCPTSIDVYGSINLQLPGCGGPEGTNASVENGYFSPGTTDYDATLAGRLLARLTDDPDLVPLFGQTWTVRSCAGPGETLSQLAPPIPEDACGGDSPATTGEWLTSCTADPAPVLLFSAGMLDDACHGGGPDSGEPDDPATYQKHYAQRMDAFLASRIPRLALVGPMTEWTAPPASAQFPQFECVWARPDWDEQGLQYWTETHDATVEVEVVPDLHADFREHHICCRSLGGSCSTDWFSRGPRNSGFVNCDGAQALVDFWYSHLKATLLASDYQCP